MPRKRREGKKKQEKSKKGERGKGDAQGSTPSLTRLPVDPLTHSPVPPSASSVAIVGAGRLGTALGRALAASGYHVSAVVARTHTSALAASRLIASKPCALSLEQLVFLPSTRLLFITTPDDALPEMAARLAITVRNERRRPIALHASGALSSSVLAPLRERGFHVASMHPLVSVSHPVAGALSLRDAYYCIEGDAPAARAARRLVSALGGRSFSIDTNDKALYHAAAVMTSGHTVALFDIATNLLKRCGLSGAQARRALVPLLRSTIENLSAQTPSRALTGTFARADTATVRRHLAALQDQPAQDDALAVYALLGQHSLRLAAENNADPHALAEIARMLIE